jgi:hypothetical protein
MRRRGLPIISISISGGFRKLEGAAADSDKANKMLLRATPRRLSAGPIRRLLRCIRRSEPAPDACARKTFHDLRAERREVVRFAARDQTLVRDDFLIDPSSAGIFEVLPD